MDTRQCDESLTIARARSLVERAESAFSTAAKIQDAFEPFAAAGAVDRQEAYTALLLVIAEYFVATRSASQLERERFDQYVYRSRLVAVRVICDGLSRTDVLTRFATECADGFDKFIQWLFAQEQSSANFWPNTYKRLGIDRASSPALDLPALLTYDMPQLSELIGRTFQLPHKGEILNCGFELQSASGNSQYLTYKSRGLSVLLEESAISAIFLYHKNDIGYATFPNKLSGGIRFGDSRSRVRTVLGKPNRSNGMSDMYVNDDKSLHFEFREWLGTLKMVAISQRYSA